MRLRAWLSLFCLVPTAERVTCMQRGMCAGTSPYGDVMEHPPRRMIATIRAGLIEQVFTSESLLACVACYAAPPSARTTSGSPASCCRS